MLPVDINSAWEIIRKEMNILAKESLGYYELKKHKPWFNMQFLHGQTISWVAC
jgi:hypothetical protein